LILPLSYFIEKPFQSWTRTSAAITGSVLLWVDYSFNVEQGREALKQIIENSPLWDNRFWNLQVSDATDKTIQLRVLATSADSSKSWDLRCEILDFTGNSLGGNPDRARGEVLRGQSLGPRGSA
jgi:hypothetical protein